VFNQIGNLIILLLLSGSCYAELSDPTRPAYPVDAQPAPIYAESEPKLTGIWISAKSRWASINGIQAKQGQIILGNIKVIKIGKNSVKINQNGNIKTLQLLKRPYPTQ
jgi:hypothetical protein